MKRANGWAQWATLVVLLTGAGCGGKRASDAWVDRLPLPADTMTVQMSEQGRHGGRFVQGATSDPRTFNPIMANESTSNQITGLLFTSLTDIDYRTQADVPMLAKSWELSNGDLTVTYRLRRGACFSDGRPITSADVLFSFDAVLSPTVDNAISSGLVADVGGKSVPYTYSAPDSYTFVVTAPAPDALLLSHCASVRILPRHVLAGALAEGRLASAYGTDTKPESLVTSGAFRLEAFTPNERVVLGRNPWWFGVDAAGKRLPYLDQVVFMVAADQEAVALRFRAKELDCLDNPKPEDYAGLEEDSKRLGFTLYDAGPALNTNFLFFNLNRVRESGKGRKAGDSYVKPHLAAWFRNPEFRRALSHAVDRQSIIRGPLAGWAIPGWSIMTPGAPAWFDSTITGADHDTTRAKELLDALGLRDRDGDGVREDEQGRPVAFSIMVNSENKTRMGMASLVRDDFARVGVQVTLATMDFNTLVTHARSDFEYEACLLGAGAGVPADPAMGANFWKSTGGTHYWDVSQPAGKPDTPAEGRIDALFDEHVGTLDMAVRKERYREMSRILNDECFVVWLPTVLVRIPVSNRFGNVQPSPMIPRVLWNADRIFVKQ